jgi:CRISPR-associated endoribonuclease Cas6
MQFKITLQCLSDKPVLPVNYQYELSAWIYKVIANADADFAAFLHQRGHQTPTRKSFKLFCFSQLDIPRRRVEGDRLLIECREVSLLVGFYLDHTAEEFVRGLFQEQRFKLGDRASQVDFSVKTVEIQPLLLPNDSRPTAIRTRSPLVISRKRTAAELADNPRERQDKYVSPEEPEFKSLFFSNLMEKYRAATGSEPPAWWDASRFNVQRIGPPSKSQLITIKSGKDAETKVRGFRFDFELDAPKELVELGLLAGFGRMNGEGFGCGEVMGTIRTS